MSKLDNNYNFELIYILLKFMTYVIISFFQFYFLINS